MTQPNPSSWPLRIERTSERIASYPARSSRLVFLGLALVIAASAFLRLPALGQTAAGQIRFKKESALNGEFRYAFVTNSRSASPSKPLPPPDADGVLTLDVPPEYNQQDAWLLVQDAHRNRIARLPLSSLRLRVAERAGDPLLGPSLLKNGDFKSGTEKWTLSSTSLASARMALPGDLDAPPDAGGRALRIQINAIGGNNWNIQFYQAGLDIKDGQPYVASFWAKADRPRPASFYAALDMPDWHTIGLDHRISLTPEWKKYTFVFTAVRAAEKHSRLAFILGDAPGTVDLAGIALRPGKVGRPVGPNLLKNGDFARGAEEWSPQSDPAPARATVQYLDSKALPRGVSGKGIRFDVAALGSQNWHIQLYQRGIDLAEGGHYELTFWAKADRPRAVVLDAALDVEDWHSVGLISRVSVTPEWSQHAVVFTATRPMKDHSRLAFILGDALGTVDLASVSLRRNEDSAGAPGEATEAAATLAESDFKAISAAAVSGAPHPLMGVWESQSSDPSKRYRFTFNADGTGSMQPVSASPASGAPPRARVSNAFRWYLSDGGRRIVIGSQSYAWTIAETEPGERLILTKRSGKPLVLYRRPNLP